MRDKAISIVIPTCNRNDLLDRCLQKLSPGAQTLGCQHYEVIVTDDSRENIAKGLIGTKYPWASWVEGPKRGPAANRNNGARCAQGDWLIFVDDDCIPDDCLIAAYHSAIVQYPGQMVFEGRTYAERPKQRMDEDAPINETGGYLWSCNFMVARELFHEVGGFNESFPYAAMEDVELRDRIAKVSEAKFVSQAAVLHPWRLVTRPFVKWDRAFDSHKIYFGINPEALARLHPGALFVRMISTVIRKTALDLIKYRGRGLAFPLQYHVFQLRLFFFVLRAKWLKNEGAQKR